ncbi:MAG: T9SS type A sorting domain-containing protein [Bacteroidales bacterium]|nr:T9SS type A sorting domain-containing protein [Bacteroidales bacterium]
MRKFLLIMLVFLAAQTFAQQDYQFRVSSFMSEDAQVVHTYNYADPTGVDLRGIHIIDLVDPSFPYESIDSLHYDANGNVIRYATHQIVNDSYQLVCYCDYTYNEMNLRTTRKNYNVFDGDHVLGGTYYYNYNEEGQMTDWLLEFAGIDYQKGELSYYDNGLLKEELFQTNPFTGVFENETLVEYFYDENDNLVETHEYTWSYETNEWGMNSMEFREYDEVGNCTQVMSTSASGAPQVKYVYKYDDKVLAENIYFSPNPENDFPVFPQMHNMLTSYEFWALDQNGGGLVYVLDYLLNYEQIGEIGLSASINVEEEEICLGDPITLNVEAYGGTGDYTYSWTPAELLDDAESQNPVATPTETGEVTFTVTVDDGLETVEASITILVKDCISVEENILNNVSIYPNPAEDFIMINSENVEFAEVIDIYGRVITASEINGETRIDMSDFANGIYYVRLHRNGETAVQKVVKN